LTTDRGNEARVSETDLKRREMSNPSRNNHVRKKAWCWGIPGEKREKSSQEERGEYKKTSTPFHRRGVSLTKGRGGRTTFPL